MANQTNNQQIDIEAWRTRLAKYGVGLLSPFSSNEVKKTGYTLITLSAILLLSSINIIGIQTGTLLGLRITDKGNYFTIILLAICAYVFLIYIFEILQEHNAWKWRGKMTDNERYFPQEEILEINSALTEREEAALLELKNELEEMLEKSGLDKEITEPDTSGLPQKQQLEILEAYATYLSSRRDMIELLTQYQEAQNAVLNNKLSSIKQERAKLNEILKQYSWETETYNKVYITRKVIEIIFPTILFGLAVYFAIVHLTSPHHLMKH